MFNNDSKKQQVVNTFQTLIGSDCILKGTVEGAQTIKIDGKIEGDIIWKDDVILEEGSVCSGNIVCSNASISGNLTGNVTCSDTLNINRTGHIEGDIASSKLIVQDGGVFEGKCSMNQCKSTPLFLENSISPEYDE